MEDNIQAFQNRTLLGMKSNHTTLNILNINDILQTNLLDLSEADFPEYIVPLHQFNSTPGTGLTVWEHYPSTDFLQNIPSLYIDALRSWLADVQAPSSWS
jgi:hypothetical protein